MSLTKTAAEMVETPKPPDPRPNLAPVTRIDFFYVNHGAGTAQPRFGWTVRRYLDGWTATTPPAIIENDPPLKPTAKHPEPRPFDLEEALSSLERAGWTVMRWQGGARAWKGPAQPVRTREQIKSIRRRLNRELLDTAGHPSRTTLVDLAYVY